MLDRLHHSTGHDLGTGGALGAPPLDPVQPNSAICTVSPEKLV
jgi:hypothetical protein